MSSFFKRLTSAVIVSTALAAGVCGFACADEFELRDGSTLEGKIIAQMGSQYLIQTSSGQVRVDIYDIKKIKTAPAPKKQPTGDV